MSFRTATSSLIQDIASVVVTFTHHVDLHMKSNEDADNGV